MRVYRTYGTSNASKTRMHGWFHGGFMTRGFFSLMLVLLTGCSVLHWDKRNTLPSLTMSTQMTEADQQMAECMKVQACDDAAVFPIESWNLAEQTEVARLMSAADRFNIDRATRCISLFDQQISRHIRNQDMTVDYTAEEVKAKRTSCVAMYHRLMQSLIEIDDPLETIEKRWSRAQLVLSYTEQLANWKIQPVEVNLQPRDLVKAYQKGVREDVAAVKDKRWTAKDLCLTIAHTEKTPPHALPKHDVERLQCNSETNTAVQTNPR